MNPYFEMDFRELDLPITELIKKLKNHPTVLISKLKTESSLQRLSQILPNCPDLTKLIFDRIHMKDAVVREIELLLPLCLNLESLEFTSRNTRMSIRNLKRIISVLPNLPRLSYLHLEDGFASNLGASELARALPKCPNLREVALVNHEKLDYNLRFRREKYHHEFSRGKLPEHTISNRSAIEIAEVLPVCKELRVLRIEGNDVRYEGAKALAEAIPRSHLRSLEVIESIRVFRQFSQFWTWYVFDRIDEVQRLMDDNLKNNVEGMKRARKVARFFYGRCSGETKVTKQDLDDFSLWKNSHGFWVESIGTADEDVRMVIDRKIINYIDRNYLELTGVVRDVKTMRKNDKDVTGLHDLPPELMIKIFSHLQFQDVIDVS